MPKLANLSFLLAAAITGIAVCSVFPSSSDSAGKSEPACLLQSTFSSSDLTLDDTNVDEATSRIADEVTPPATPKSAILFESNVLEETSTKDLLVRSKARSQSCKAHLLYLDRHANKKLLEHSRNVSNVNINKLVKGFISQQSGSQDACSSQLMEAKHQLNQIHAYVTDLIVQVNTTERAIVALEKAMEDKLQEVNILDKWKVDELKKCELKKQEYIEMYGKLSAEMKEMKQIASPGVSMDVKTGAVSMRPGAAAELGLMQVPLYPGSHAKSMQKLKVLISGTQFAAKQYIQCMSHNSEHKARLLQLHRSVVVDSFEVRDVTEQAEQAPKFKLTKKKQTCEETYGDDWKTVSTGKLAKACGCNVKNKDKKKWCKCPSVLEPLLGNMGQWVIVGLKDGQAMGLGYKYNVKFTSKDASKTPIDLCFQKAKKPELQVATAAPVTVGPTITHVDPPELQVGTAAPVTVGPTITHVDPKPLQVATAAPVTVAPTVTIKHVDDFGNDFDVNSVPMNRLRRGPAAGTGPAAGLEPLDDDPVFGGDQNGLGAGGEDEPRSPLTIDDLRDEDDMATDAAVQAMKDDAASPEYCAAEKKKLEETYVKTYVELSRLKDEYHDLANSTACFDQVETTYKSRKTPLQQDIDELIKAIDVKTDEIERLRPRLESATKAEKKLRRHIKTLSAECAQLPATVSNLDKVRDAIQALSKCPGLSRVQFSLPKWTGTWIVVPLKAKKLTDEEQDAVFDAACAKETDGARAAEVAEIEEQTVEGIPETNTAGYPLIGTCPNCEGDEATDFPDGHKRVCWRQGKELTHAGKVTGCAGGKKAVLCVVDRENIREIPGEE